MSAKVPSKLYRYRPLHDDECVIKRELDALRESYLYAPSFEAMNDPMEAFYETGGASDDIVNAMMAPTGKHVGEMYKIVSEIIDRFALISFAGTHEDLPMWAYYASNFAGMCLEFETAAFEIGDLAQEPFKKVTYARTALPPLTFLDVTSERSKEAIIARITRKRIEWAHEKEWRLITGQVGPKYYLDDALRRVFLGPRIKPEHASCVSEVLKDRPVEILQGEISGFELTFRVVKPARPLFDCERVGAGRFDPENHLYVRKEVEPFLMVPYDALVDECRRIIQHPNAESIDEFYVSGDRKDSLFLWTTYKLRSGREVYNKRYFDRKLRLIPRDHE